MSNASQPDAQAADPRRWLSLFIIVMAAFMVVLDTFIVNVAIPSIQQDLGASFAKLQLIVAAYVLGYAVLLITGGRLGDLFGRKRMFLIGMAGFVAASAWCGFAQSADMLIVARVFQGVLAAAMTPQVLSLIHVTFPAGEKPKAMAIYGASLGLAAVTGQLVGGGLLEANWWGMGWRLVFLVNVPIGIVAFVSAMRLLRESRDAKRHRMDFAGIGLLIAGLGLFVYPIVVGREEGWPVWAFVSMAASIVIIAYFVKYENGLLRRGLSPLLPMTLFKDRSFRLGVMIVSALFSGNSALYFILGVFMQSGRGASPIESAYAFAPMAVGFFAASLLAPRLRQRWGNRVLQAGAILMVISYVSLTGIVGETTGLGMAEMSVPWLLAGLGQGAITSPLIHTVLAGVQPQNAGAASGAFMTFLQISSAIGIAVIGTFYQSLLENYGGSSIAAAHNHTLVGSLVILIVLALLTFALLRAISRKPAEEKKLAEQALAR